jgi:hypothetical protein
MMWRIIVGALLACLLGVGGWSATRTATMSDRHPTRHEFEEVQNTIRTNQVTLEKKIDRIIDHIIEGG